MNTEHLTEVVYTPSSDLLNPVKFVRAMFADLFACRELAWRLFVRDFSARYRQSFLGYIWAFIPPLATTITFVFLRSQGLVTTGDTGVPYPLYVIIGMLFWQLFVDAIQCPLKAVSASKAVLSKIQFPPEAILLAGLGEVLFSLAIRFLLLIAVFTYYGIVPPPTVWLLPVSVAALLIMGFTLGVLVTPLGVLYTDVTQTLAVVTSFWFFLTPVIYPARETGLAGVIARWNPVSPLLIAGRDWLTIGSTNHLPEFIVMFGLSLAALFAGWVCYRIALPHLITRIGN